ncbi:hypothetical protein D3C72_1987700 [compost metagenome]
MDWSEVALSEVPLFVLAAAGVEVAAGSGATGTAATGNGANDAGANGVTAMITPTARWASRRNALFSGNSQLP